MTGTKGASAAKRIRAYIEGILNDSGENRRASLGSFLSMMSVAYEKAVRQRARWYRTGILSVKTLPCYVISIGNLTLGGTGKTPMTVYVARLLTRLGYRVAVISRGYKGRAEKSGGMVSDGRRILMGPDQAGDEPLMMARRLKNVCVVVGADRFEAGRMAITQEHPDVIVLDDGFQHLKLSRNLDLVLLDGSRPFGNGRLFPRGMLREPISAMARADAVIFTRTDSKTTGTIEEIRKKFPALPFFRSVHTPYVHAVIERNSGSKAPAAPDRQFRGKTAFVFSGIARNRDFLRTLDRFGCRIAGVAEFPDHHLYTDTDLDAVARAASDRSSDIIFTTEKDFTRMDPARKWPVELAVIGIDISFEDHGFDQFIKSKLDGIAAFR